MSAGAPPRESIPNLVALDRLIETGRLRLRPFVGEDTDAIWPIVSDVTFPKHMSWAAHATKAETSEWIASLERMAEAGRGLVWAMEYEGVPVGSIGLDNLQWQVGVRRTDRAELGYWLAPALHDQGIVTEAASAVCRFAFETLQLHKLTIGCVAENLASKRVIEKLGFRFTGRHEEDVWRDGQWWAHLRYELLSDEFPDVHTTMRITRPT